MMTEAETGANQLDRANAALVELEAALLDMVGDQPQGKAMISAVISQLKSTIALMSGMTTTPAEVPIE